ncbi:hypothetical protein [Photobacterium minamisatsumaniensis]|uniref:hypothetical protein n=1 Tax=Photobacterium minamisatsumaniensis TaxID=2910233 RepID=UPI003D13A620
MSSHDRIEDIEQRIDLSYNDGNYQEAKALEAKLNQLRGNHSLYDNNEPYSIEGRTFMEND